MPIFSIKIADGPNVTPEECKELYSEISKKISEIHKCPIEAVSGSIEVLPLYAMGQGPEDWEAKIYKEEVYKKEFDSKIENLEK